MPRSSPPPSLRPQRGEIPIVGDVYRAHIILLVRFTQGIFGNDPLANYQADHPSNPQQPIQQPYVKRTSKSLMAHVTWLFQPARPVLFWGCWMLLGIFTYRNHHE